MAMFMSILCLNGSGILARICPEQGVHKIKLSSSSSSKLLLNTLFVSKAEKGDPSLFARNVEKVFSKAAGIPVSTISVDNAILHSKCGLGLGLPIETARFLQ